MTKSILVFVTAPAALLGACGSHTTTTMTTTNASTVETTNIAAIDNAVVADNMVDVAAPAAPAAAGSLSAYEGKQPFDKVAGKTFTQADAVKAAIAASGAAPKVRDWLANTDGPAGPIVMQAGKLFMTECQTHKCGDHKWTIAIAPDGTSPEICYYDAQVSKTPQWFVDGKPVDRPAAGSAGCIQPDH